MVALCFMEMAGQYPLAGSVYNWSKRVAGDFAAWMTGWIYVVGSIVTVAAVAVAWQVVLPQVSTFFQFVGSNADAGTYVTKGGAQNALLLGAILVVFGTVVNMLGVKVMARINNFGVMAELIGASILVILLLVNATRGPGIVLHNFGLGAGHKWGYFGAFIIGGIMSAYVMYGFDTAGHARRGDERAASEGASGDHPRADRRVDHRRPADPVRADECAEHPSDQHPAARPAVHHQAGARQHDRERLPDRRGDRDLGVHARGDGVVHPAAVRDGARRPAAVRHAHRPRVGPPQGAGHAGARRRDPCPC